MLTTLLVLEGIALGIVVVAGAVWFFYCLTPPHGFFGRRFDLKIGILFGALPAIGAALMIWIDWACWRMHPLALRFHMGVSALAVIALVFVLLIAFWGSAVCQLPPFLDRESFNSWEMWGIRLFAAAGLAESVAMLLGCYQRGAR